MEPFSASECISFGWETFKKRAWFFIGVTVLYVIASFVLNFVGGFISGFLLALFGSIVSHIAGFCVSVLLNSVLSVVLISFLLKAHEDAEHVSIDDAMRLPHYWNFVGMGILREIAVVIGLILLIVPGVIVSLMFSLAGYLTIEQGLRPIEALKESMRLTNGHKGTLFLLVLMTIGLGIIGVVCLLVGMLVAGPVVALAWVHAYRQLQKRVQPAVAAAPGPTPAAA